MCRQITLIPDKENGYRSMGSLEPRGSAQGAGGFPFPTLPCRLPSFPALLSSCSSTSYFCRNIVDDRSSDSRPSILYLSLDIYCLYIAVGSHTESGSTEHFNKKYLYKTFFSLHAIFYNLLDPHPTPLYMYLFSPKEKVFQ